MAYAVQKFEKLYFLLLNLKLWIIQYIQILIAWSTSRHEVLKESHFLLNYLLGKKRSDEYVSYTTGVYKKEIFS